MKKYNSTNRTRIINIFKTKQKVLLWTLWRSGTHWLADMLSDMLEIPTIYEHIDGNDYEKETIDQLHSHKRNTILIRHICLNPNELFQHTDRLGFKVIFLYRDPRDVLASHVNMRKYVEGYRIGLPPFPDMNISEIFKWEIENHREQYTCLLPEWVQTEHDNLHKVRYEELIKDTIDSLEEISKFLGLSIEQSKLKQIVEDNDFKKRTKRQKGEEDKSSHNRKGIIGDYVNQFTIEEQELLNNMLHDVLIKMGYK